MSEFIIPLFYQMWGTVKVEANSLEEAKEKALNDPNIHLPSNPSYVEDSLNIDEEGIPIYNLIKGQEDEFAGK